jgi:hypothetical protein
VNYNKYFAKIILVFLLALQKYFAKIIPGNSVMSLFCDETLPSSDDDFVKPPVYSMGNPGTTIIYGFMNMLEVLASIEQEELQSWPSVQELYLD